MEPTQRSGSVCQRYLQHQLFHRIVPPPELFSRARGTAIQASPRGPAKARGFHADGR